MPFISLAEVCKQYKSDLVACNNVNLCVEKGQVCLLKGNDLLCKSTLLDIIGGMDRPTAGIACVDGTDLSLLRGGKLNAYRRKVGFVYADETALLGLTVGENIMLSAHLCKVKASADKLLAAVGLDNIADEPVRSLDNKQRQLVCVARALARRPEVLLFDVDEGLLDAHSLLKVAAFIKKMCDKFGMTAVISLTGDRLDSLADVIYTFDADDAVEKCGGAANE